MISNNMVSGHKENNQNPEILRLSTKLRNGDIISQRQFTRLILEVESADSITLLSMAYMSPPGGEGSVTKIHNHLLNLANNGTQITIGVDNVYSKFFAPHTDIPNIIAPYFLDRETIQNEERKRTNMYTDLANHPKIKFSFNGEKHLPLSIDHRKILCIRDKTGDNFGVVYGFNMDKTLDHEVDSAVFIKDLEAIEWLEKQSSKEHFSQPEKATFENFAFTTREVVKNGGFLANQQISDIVNNAQRNLIFCSQFIPDGSLLNEIAEAADRGVDINIISNGPSPSRQPMYQFKRKIVEKSFNKVYRSRDNIRFFIPNDPSAFIHMKALIADIDQPEIARALTGTDNMSNRFRTREILVELLKYENINRLYQYFNENVLPGIKLVEP